MDSPLVVTRADRGLTMPVLGGGLITGALALLGVWALNRASDDFNIMGWYANYVIPVGAILVGLVAGLGYGIAAWWMDRRVGNLMIGAIVLLQLGVYVMAQYIEYRQLNPHYEDGSPVGFWFYFDFMTRAFAFKEKHGDGFGEPMGTWGYAFRALEMAGFAFGGLIAPLILRALPYCHTCGVYMKSRELGVLPGGLRPRKFKKTEDEARAAFERDEARIMEESLKAVEVLGQIAAQGEIESLVAHMAPYQAHRKENEKLSCRLHVNLNECRMCGNGALNVTAHRGHGNQITQVPVGVFPLITNPTALRASEPADTGAA